VKIPEKLTQCEVFGYVFGFFDYYTPVLFYIKCVDRTESNIREKINLQRRVGHFLVLFFEFPRFFTKRRN